MSAIDQSNISENLLKGLVNEASSVLADGHVTFGEIVHLGGILAGKVNQFSSLSGQQKQALVLKAVDCALDEILSLKIYSQNVDNLSSPEKASLMEFEQKVKAAAIFAKETLPAVLDVAVQVARGKIDLGKPGFYKNIIQLIHSLFACLTNQFPVIPKVVTNIQETQKESSEMTLPPEPVPETTPPQSESEPVAEARLPSKASE